MIETVTPLVRLISIGPINSAIITNNNTDKCKP